MAPAYDLECSLLVENLGNEFKFTLSIKNQEGILWLPNSLDPERVDFQIRDRQERFIPDKSIFFPKRLEVGQPWGVTWIEVLPFDLFGKEIRVFVNCKTDIGDHFIKSKWTQIPGV